MSKALEFIKENKIIIIYRGYTPDQCLELTRELYDVGIRLFEVTFNSDKAAESIKLLASEFKEASIGAGTVLNIKQVDQAAEAGAEYIISPNLKVDVIKRTKERGLISIPGAFSPSEIQAAVEAGADMVKIFPIDILGATYLSNVKGPLNHVLFMPSGGIDLMLAQQLFAAGSTAIGLGVHILGQEAIKSKDWSVLSTNTKQFIQAAGL